MRLRLIASISILVLLLFITSFDVQQLALFGISSSTSTAKTTSSSSSDVVELFDGASDFLSLLRKAHQKKIANPPPHCQQSNNATNENDMRVEIYNRAIEVDWIGRDLPAVEPTWSSPDTASCNFVGLEFPPTKTTLQVALHQKTYISSFHTAHQCEGDSFHWDREKPATCLGNNFGGTLGAVDREGCTNESPGGYPMVLWNKQNSNNDLFQCLKHFFQTDEVLRDVNVTTHMEGIIANLKHNDTGRKGGYCPSCDEVDWSTLAFCKWSQSALKSIGVVTEEQMFPLLKRLLNAQIQSKRTNLTKCVEKLLPPMIGETNSTTEQKRIWKETGAYLFTSTMQQSPSSLLRTFSGSLNGVLPPSPTAIYSVNALLGTVVNVKSEAYYPGCTAYWNAVLRRNDKGASPKKAFSETNSEAKKDGSIFAKLKGAPHILRNEIIETCAEDESFCPFPIYDLVIDVAQVYCGGFFHWMIEIWPRLGPFLDGLLAENMPNFAIRTGCKPTFHHQFYELAGLENITLISDNPPVFAKEVIAPTEGFSHSSLLNYWNLVSMRQKVISNLEPIEKSANKTVLVIIRDASRRPDHMIYSEKFLKELSEGLPEVYEVIPFRSSDKELMSCLACQVRAFMTADVIIGSHGAGLSHSLFAKTGALVMERIDKGDSGIYAELAFLLGMKYFPMDDNEKSASAYADMITFADGY